MTGRRPPGGARSTNALARPALALGAGALVALSMPPWGFWPLAIVGVMLFEVALGDAAARRATDAARLALRRRMDVPRDGVDGAADPARVPGRRQPCSPASTCWPQLRGAGRAVAGDRASSGAHAGRGGAVLVPVRWRPAGDDGDVAGRRPARRRRPRRRRDPAHLGRVPARHRRWSTSGASVRDRRRGTSPGVRATPQAAIALGVIAVVASCSRPIAPQGSATGETLRVAAVQGGGEQGTSALEVPPRLVTERHLEATRSIPDDADLDLVLWPENTIDVDVFEGSDDLRRHRRRGGAARRADRRRRHRGARGSTPRSSSPPTARSSTGT